MKVLRHQIIVYPLVDAVIQHLSDIQVSVIQLLLAKFVVGYNGMIITAQPVELLLLRQLVRSWDHVLVLLHQFFLPKHVLAGLVLHHAGDVCVSLWFYLRVAKRILILLKMFELVWNFAIELICVFSDLDITSLLPPIEPGDCFFGAHGEFPRANLAKFYDIVLLLVVPRVRLFWWRLRPLIFWTAPKVHRLLMTAHIRDHNCVLFPQR